MASRLAAARQAPDECFKALLSRRSRPYIVLLDADLNVAFADPYAFTLLEARFGYRQTTELPPPLRDSIEALIRRRRDDGALPENVIGPIDGLVLRIVPLAGPLGSFYAIFVEKEARREDLTDAVTQFSLTPREVEVLELILGGMNAAEIAEALHIAEVTVFDHFKHISQKTDARNRADMLAKIFNWQADLTGKGPRPHT
ncbi:MAG TPA: helix-turn-helix transcriptional regulator [Candidatus Limnocylindria bacterium]|jgi:DNA-binding CsgD family transcriptional regulator|nr:helix-turn-helix transcriptional regulator [Candidatus Limnocylindria bacterium]